MLKKKVVDDSPQDISADDLPAWAKSGDTVAGKRTAKDQEGEDLDNMGKTTLMRVALKGFVRLMRAADTNKDLLHGIKFGMSCFIFGACVAGSVILWAASTWGWASLASITSLVPLFFAAKNFWQQVSAEPGPIAKEAQETRTKKNITALGMTIEN